tara:strand:+ start:37330 stop:37506 length:177 start_codon:yes stop_codon:yes gene_type:complete
LPLDFAVEVVATGFFGLEVDSILYAKIAGIHHYQIVKRWPLVADKVPLEAACLAGITL